MTHKYLFFHGGPGFNSNPEAHLLLPSFAERGLELVLWNEPSALRGFSSNSTSRFKEGFQSAAKFLAQNAEKTSGDEGKVTLLGHSFGSRWVVHLCREFPQLISQAILIAPALDLHHADLQIFSLCARDFEEEGDMTKSAQLRAIIQTSQPGFSDWKLQGYLLALSNPTLFNHYWQTSELKEKYLSYLVAPEFAFDLDSFEALRRADPLEFLTEHRLLDVPVRLIFGQNDPLIDRTIQEAAASKIFKNSESLTLPKSSHYPHLEQVSAFLHSGLTDFGRPI